MADGLLLRKQLKIELWTQYHVKLCACSMLTHHILRKNVWKVNILVNHVTWVLVKKKKYLFFNFSIPNLHDQIGQIGPAFYCLKLIEKMLKIILWIGKSCFQSHFSKRRNKHNLQTFSTITGFFLKLYVAVCDHVCNQARKGLLIALLRTWSLCRIMKLWDP